MCDKTVQKIFPALGTVNAVTIYDGFGVVAAEHVKKRVLELHRRFSLFAPESDVSKINRQAGIKPVYVHKDTIFVLSNAQMYARGTQGTFDVTAGAASRIWREAIRFEELPPDQEIEKCRSLRGICDLKLNEAEGTAFLCRKGLQIDLGGIAKGYAADEAKKVLGEYEIHNAVINFGGTVVSLGEKRRVGIQNPFQKNGEWMAELVVENEAVVTSGFYERGFILNNKRYHHIIDPRTGKPSASGLLSVTLVGQNSMELDALATGVCVLGEKRGLPVLEERGIEAVFVNDDGEVKITPGLQSRFFMKE